MPKQSISSITGKIFDIPSKLDDAKSIDNFVKSNQDKSVVVVQGLGFVGSVMSLVCANALHQDYAVIGIDLPTKDCYWKICSINEGVFPVISSDKKVEEFYQAALEKKNLYATYDSHAYKHADVIIVDINLDVNKESFDGSDYIDYSVDLNGFKSAISSIGRNCKEDVLVLIETTVPPGTTNIAKDILKKELEFRELDSSKIKIGHSYERVMPGPNYIDSIQNFYRVYSGIDQESADSVEKFLKTIIRVDEYPLTRLKNTNSTEMSKVLENSFRAMNIAFIVEWSRYAEEAGVDLFEVVEAIRARPTHKNIMLPGIGVGGYCLTKDPLLASWSKKNIMNSENGLSMSERAVNINDQMPFYAFNFLNSHYSNNTLYGKNIRLLGVSYAPDIGDTRYSPVENLYKLLEEKKCNIKAHDPFISIWEELNVAVDSELIEFDADVDIVIFSTGHSVYRNNTKLIKALLELENIMIYDTIGVLNQNEINLLQNKNTVKVLGRGDL